MCIGASGNPIVGFTLIGRNDIATMKNKTLADATNDIAANQLRLDTEFVPLEAGGATGDVLVKTATGAQFQPAPGDGGTATSLTVDGVIYPIADADTPAVGEVLTFTGAGVEFVATGGGGAASQLIVNGVTYTISDVLAPAAGEVLTFNGASLRFEPPNNIASPTNTVSANQLTVNATSYPIAGGPPVNKQYLQYDSGNFQLTTLMLVSDGSFDVGANVIVVDGTQFPISTVGVPAEGSVLTRIGANMEFVLPGTSNAADALIINNVTNTIENASTPDEGTVLKKTATGIEFGPDHAVGITTSSNVVTVNLSVAPTGEGFVLTTTSADNAIWSRNPIQDLRINYVNTINTASASGTSALALGESTVSSADYSMAIGNAAQAISLNAIAFGHGTTANIPDAIVIGSPSANVFPIWGSDTTSGTKLVNAADDVAAAAAGVPLGGEYHNNGARRVRIV